MLQDFPIARRVAATSVVFVLMVATVASGVVFRGISLASILLVLFVEVEVIALLANAWMSLIAAVSAVAAANWFLVPPFHTFVIAEASDFTALAVFIIGALATSWLMGRAMRIGAQGVRSRREVEAYHALMDSGWPRSDPNLPLLLLADATGLDEVQLRDRLNHTVAGARRGGPNTPQGSLVIDEELPGGYLVVGLGSPRLRPDRQSVICLGNAAVRSIEEGAPGGHSARQA